MNENKNKISIDCYVESCIHHSKDGCCTADKISIGNPEACTCNETCCDTFRAKN